MTSHLTSAISEPHLKAVVIHPQITRHRLRKRGTSTDEASLAESSLTEACRLAEAIALEVCSSAVSRIDHPSSRTLLASGSVDSIAAVVAEHQAGLVIVNRELTPVQQRNLEQAFAAKVIDRTGLILEIFGARARSREGQLQVELASLSYQRSRLVRSWTHLERQRGGFGFLGGPGESQVELDRRLIGERIVTIKRALEKVRQRRRLHRSSRIHPLVALVGYTNAGKSTLFNSLTKAQVASEDRLFVTLDPTMRGLTLASGHKVILSDTVGFISELPTQLIAAFRATLEEVTAADLILHVRDIAHPETLHQCHAVEEVLRSLGIEQGDERLFEVHNKIDLFECPPASETRSIALSALQQCTLEALLMLIDQQLAGNKSTLSLSLDYRDSKALSWLYRRGRVLECKDERGRLHVRVALTPLDQAHFEKHYSYIPEETC